ncbi:MAG TPA: hypothetical protein VF271_04010 [Rhodanobacteraceae bacterium]
MAADSISPTPPRFRLQLWRVAVWLVLLLAVFGILQYCVHGWHVAQALQAPGNKHAHDGLIGLLVWDVAYLVGACITLAVTASALMWRSWSRRALRIVAVIWALWFLATGILLAARYVAYLHHSEALLDGPQLSAAARALLDRVHRSYEVGIALKAAAVVVLAWLAWRLGMPAVCAQFAGRSSLRK